MSIDLDDEEKRFIKDWIKENKELEVERRKIRVDMMEKIASTGIIAFLGWVGSIIIEHYSKKG